MAVDPHAKSEVAHGQMVVSHLEQSELFQQYRADFEETTGLPLALRPAEHFAAVLNFSRSANPFCQQLARTNPACAACSLLQAKFTKQTDHTSETLECFAGLVESGSAVRLGVSVIAYLQTGQVLLHQPTQQRFDRIAARLNELGVHANMAELRRAYFHTRVLHRKHYESIVRLMHIFAQHLAVVSNRIFVQEHATEPPAVKRARAYVAEHMSEELSLAQVARACNMSAFYFCKVFKKATGTTFTDFLARQRVERVKQELLNPHVRVSESAFANGFQSLSQFNRVFRRIAGESPSAYRERIHGETPECEQADESED